MLKVLRRLVTGAGRSYEGQVPQIEGLEKRSLLSATLERPPVSAAEDPDVTPPTVVKEQLFGADPRAVEGVIITFSEALDPATAQELDNFRVGRRTDRKQNNIDNANNNSSNKHGLVKFLSAVYDPANFTVTLTAKEPFNLTRRFRTIRVLGRDETDVGIRDIAGNVLDGDKNGRAKGDSVEQFTFTRGHRLKYGELDGDNVSLSITGPGRLWVIRNTSEGRVRARGDALRVYIENAEPGRTVITGKVTGRGNGVAVIDELVNTSTATIQIASDPAFQIVTSIP